MRQWIFLFPLLAGSIFLCACAAPAPEGERGLFSWEDSALEEEGRQELLGWMRDRELTVLYQSVPEDCPAGTLEAFLTEAAENRIAVYLLTGDPGWGLDPAGEAMTEEVLRAASWNQEFPEGVGFRGVLMDTEPYLTAPWEEDPEAVMEAYVDGMSQAAACAREKNLEYVACIPYYYDTWKLEKPLARLFQEGCTGAAVMNYYRENEAEHIRTEAELARAAGRPLTVLYELQPPGVHGLTEKNTYYEEGMEALLDSWQRLQEELGPQGLSMAVHEYQWAKEVWTLE